MKAIAKLPGVGKEKGFIKWNFTKFVVDKDGKVVYRFGPTDVPGDFEDKIKEFAINYAENEDFLQYCKTSTANTANVRGRLDYFKKNILV